jgi:hypothetical protein
VNVAIGRALLWFFMLLSWCVSAAVWYSLIRRFSRSHNSQAQEKK